MNEKEQRMKIIIETIPHAEQRYPTVGDWQFKKEDNETLQFLGWLTVDMPELHGVPTGRMLKSWERFMKSRDRGDELTLRVKVSEMGNWRYEALVGLHEAVEALLARGEGISEADVDAFDIAYEKSRLTGDVSEPGDHPACPVYKQHQFATAIERLVAAEMRVDWQAYSKTVEALT
jgi:hypothetical protein